MIDLDPQASLTISTGLEPENLEKTILMMWI
nr:AAA family ATPase [Clostridium sp. FP2]